MTDEELDRLADRLAEKMEARKSPAVTQRLLDLTQAAAFIGVRQAEFQAMVERGFIPVTRLDDGDDVCQFDCFALQALLDESRRAKG